MDQFIIRLIITFIVGGAWITLISVIAEKFGTKLGGVIAGVPTTTLLALFFIGWTQSPEIASQATTLVPIVSGINTLVVVIYLLLVKRGFFLALSSALSFWLLSSFTLVKLNFNNFIYSLIGLVVLISLSYFILEKKLRIKSKGKRKVKYTFPQILFRAGFSGIIITLAVYLAKVSGPLLGSAFANFPAMVLSTLIITHLAHGRSFSSAIIKVTAISANINVSVYAIAVRFFYPIFGLIIGTIISFSIALVSLYLVNLFVKKKMA